MTFDTRLGEVTKTVDVPSYIIVKSEKKTKEWIKVSEDSDEFANDDRNTYSFKTIRVTDDNKEVMAWFWDKDSMTLNEEEDNGVYLTDGFNIHFNPSLGEVPYELVPRTFPNLNSNQAAIDAINASNVDDATKAALIAVIEAAQ